MKAIFNEIKTSPVKQIEFNEESWLKVLKDTLDITFSGADIRVGLINVASLAISAIEHYDCRLRTDEELTEEMLHHINRLIEGYDNIVLKEMITKYLHKHLTLSDCVDRLKEM